MRPGAQCGQASRADSRNRSISAGSRRTAVDVGLVALRQLERPRVGERLQPPFADQLLVDAAEPAAVRRVDGHAERGRLAVHRPAGRDDEVGERDQALRVDGAVRAGSPTAARGAARTRAAPRSAAGRTRARSRPAEVLERLREERVRVPVVERHVGRRPQDDEHARRVDAEPLEQRPVGLEVREVVLLLQARVLDELRRARRRTAAAAPAGSRPGTTTRVAARQPSWCCSVANS